MFDFIIGILFGICCTLGLFFYLFDYFVINFIYFKNIALFEDLILTKKNKERLQKYYENKNS